MKKNKSAKLLKSLFVLMFVMLLSTFSYANYFNGTVEIQRITCVYIDADYDLKLMKSGGVVPISETSGGRNSKVINKISTINENSNSDNPSEKFVKLFGEALKRADSADSDFEIEKNKFIEETDALIANYAATGNYDAQALKLERDEYLTKETFTYETNNYLIYKTLKFVVIDNVHKSQSLLPDGKYYINNVIPGDSKYYLIRVVQSQTVSRCKEKTSSQTYDSEGFGIDSAGNRISIANPTDDQLSNATFINNNSDFVNQELGRTSAIAQAASAANDKGLVDIWEVVENRNKPKEFVPNTVQNGNYIYSKDSGIGEFAVTPGQTGIAKIEYNIETINVPIADTEGRGKNSRYYTNKDAHVNSNGIHYFVLHKQELGDVYGDFIKSRAADESNMVSHILFENKKGRGVSEVNITTDASSYLLIDFWAENNNDLNAQIEVFKDGVKIQDLTASKPMKNNALIDVTDCSLLTLRYKPVKLKVDIDQYSRGGEVPEPIGIVGKFSKDNRVIDIYEINDIKIFADMYLIF